jgi:prephenate dehydratase
MPIVAYQGEPGAFSEQAARAFFSKDVETKPVATFRDVFRFVEGGRLRAGIIPIENSLVGSVHENYDLLLRHRLYIVGEIKLRIEQHLMALPGVSLRRLRFVYSHPQALGQCEQFLRTLRNVSVVAEYDTAGSAKMIRDHRRSDAAAIASALAARVYGLRVLKKNIESNHQNYTRFLVLSRRESQPTAKAKTSLVFSVKNVPGALQRALAVLADENIDLLKIESRPLVGRPWEYLFYADIQGSRHEKKLRKALNRLREFCMLLNVFGSYRTGKTVCT